MRQKSIRHLFVEESENEEEKKLLEIENSQVRREYNKECLL